MKDLTELYAEYDHIQGDDPVPVGPLLSERIADRQYKERTMRQIVGLLHEFVSDYEGSVQRNEKYTVSFSFAGSWREGIPQGPYMGVFDFIDEKCVCVMCWNRGKIKKLYRNDEDDLVRWYGEHYGAVKEMRHAYGLPDSFKWDPLKVMVSGYALQLDQTNLDGTLSPILGIDALSDQQIADFLEVSKTYVIHCMRRGYDNAPFRAGYVGIAVADAEEAVRKIPSAVKDDTGAVLPLADGSSLHVPNSKTYYFSQNAAVWLIETIKSREDYMKMRTLRTKRLITKKQKEDISDYLLNKLQHITWEQLCFEGLSPIKGLGMVSRNQVIECCGVEGSELTKAVTRYRVELDRLGMVVMPTKLAAEQAYQAKRLDDFSYDMLLENGEWIHVPSGKYTFFSAPALRMALDACLE